MALDFDKYAAKGREFVRLVAEDLHVTSDKAGRIIRTVFHALRNRLSHEESFQLLAQLPMALKGTYVEGWKFEKDFQRLRHMEDFLEEVRREDGQFAGFDFGNDVSAKKAVASVFRALNYFISEGEFNDITGVLPEQIRRFVKQSIGAGQKAM